MKHSIEVNGIKVYAFHGCLPEETRIGGHYVIDVSVTTNFTQAAESDDLLKTIDYVTIRQIVSDEMAVPSRLIEHVGQRIVNRLKRTFDALLSVRLSVTKLSPPINGDVDNVRIIIEE